MCNTCGCKSAEGMNDSLFDEAQHFFEHMEKASTNALSLMQMGAIETGNYMVHIDTVIANLEARMRDYLKQSGMLNESQMDRLNIDAPMKGKIMYKAEGSCSNCGSALVMNAEGEHSCGCGTESYGGETFEAPIRQATVNPQWAKNMLDDYVAEDVLATINSLEVLRNKLAKMEGKDINEMDNKPRKIELTLEGQISMTPENITQIILALKNQYLESAGYATEESDVVGFVGDGRQIGFLDAEEEDLTTQDQPGFTGDGRVIGLQAEDDETEAHDYVPDYSATAYNPTMTDTTMGGMPSWGREASQVSVGPTYDAAVRGGMVMPMAGSVAQWYGSAEGITHKNTATNVGYNFSMVEGVGSVIGQ